MAGPWFVDDAGDGTTEDSWATADVSIRTLDTEKAFASGEIVYFGSDMQDASASANMNVSGPGAGIPIAFISSTVGAGTTVSYSPSTTNQIDTSAGAYEAQFSGAFAMFGISIKSGEEIRFTGDNDAVIYTKDCRLTPANNKLIGITTSNVKATHHNLTVDLSNDSASSSTVVFQDQGGGSSLVEIIGLSFVSPGNRTGEIFSFTGGKAIVNVSGADFSGFASSCEVVSGDTYASFTFTNCLTASTWTPNSAHGARYIVEITFINCGPADSPTYLYKSTNNGVLLSSSSIYRTGGASIEGDATSWLVTTTSINSEYFAYTCPWIYGEVASTGSKTFTVYITNDTADFTDAEVWLEVEYLGTADEANTTLVSDRRVITATAVAQTDDTASTWNGAGPSFTYKQSLAVTATVNETGQYRARVCVGLASIAGSRYFYIDPKVTVS